MNIIGCGRAAGSLGRLWLEQDAVRIGDVLNRSVDSAGAAIERLGAGRAVDRLAEMSAADVWMIGTSDGQIGAMASSLADSGLPLENTLVFHLAGRYGVDHLHSLRDHGALLAALHPVRSLTHASLSVAEFSGTACVAEGEPAALDRLQNLVRVIGGEWLPVSNIERGLYHASVSIISNVTKAVAWKAQNWLVTSGLPADTAATVTHELLSSTLSDLFRSGARQSITGPVVRGDTSTVEAHLAAVLESHPDDADVYRVLARTVLELAQDRGDLDQQTLERFQALLKR